MSIFQQIRANSTQRRKFLPFFWLLTAGLCIFQLFVAQTESVLTNTASIAITAAALLPGYLWCSGRALGAPIFPLFSLTYIWTFALPLLINHPLVMSYTPESHLTAGMTVAGFLLIGTLAWFACVNNPPPSQNYYYGLLNKGGNSFFLWVLGACTLFYIAGNGGWLIIPNQLFSAFRAAIIGLNILAGFVIAYRFGKKELSPRQSWVFIILLTINLIANAVGLLLVASASIFLLVAVAFSLGRKKVPIITIIIVISCLAFLHYGKAEMRNKYWNLSTQNTVQVWEYPTLFREWAGYSLDYLTPQNNNSFISTDRIKTKQSLLDRSSVMHLLLMVQDQSPDPIPYLNGKSYEVIPELIVPRIFNPNKIRSHEGTYRLNIHYGLQTREATNSTTIGWGLLNESYANYGLWGSIGLGIVLGLLYGMVTRWSINRPILSIQFLFTILFLAYSFQTEWTAGVYIAALVQSSFVIGFIALLLMRTYAMKNEDASLFQ